MVPIRSQGCKCMYITTYIPDREEEEKTYIQIQGKYQICPLCAGGRMLWQTNDIKHPDTTSMTLHVYCWSVITKTWTAPYF